MWTMSGRRPDTARSGSFRSPSKTSIASGAKWTERGEISSENLKTARPRSSRATAGRSLAPRSTHTNMLGATPSRLVRPSRTSTRPFCDCEPPAAPSRAIVAPYPLRPAHVPGQVALAALFDELDGLGRRERLAALRREGDLHLHLGLAGLLELLGE